MQNGKLLLLVAILNFSFAFAATVPKKSTHGGGNPVDYTGTINQQSSSSTGQATPQGRKVTEEDALKKAKEEAEKAAAKKDEPATFNHEAISDQILPDEDDGEHKIYDVAGNVIVSYHKNITKAKIDDLKPGVPYRFNSKEYGWSWWTWDPDKKTFVAMTEKRMKENEFKAVDLGFKGFNEDVKFKGRDIKNVYSEKPASYFVFGPPDDKQFLALMKQDPTMGGQIPEAVAVQVPTGAKTTGKGKSNTRTPSANQNGPCTGPQCGAKDMPR
jgi:hypothetical protein